MRQHCLIELGADVNYMYTGEAWFSSGSNALHAACSTKAVNREVLTRLVEAGCITAQRDARGRLPIDVAKEVQNDVAVGALGGI